jgi:hypothetical protein
MAKRFIDESTLTGIADAIRAKKGTSDLLDPANFADEIYGITGGGDVTVETEERDVTPTKSTQEVTPSEGKYLSKVIVYPIPDDYIVPTGKKVIKLNGNDIDVRNVAWVDVDVPTALESTDYYDGSYEVI